MTLRKPFLVASASQPVVEPGDAVHITGTARGLTTTCGGPSPGVLIWIFGRNYYFVTPTTVAEDNTFDYEVSGEMTAGMAEGQYVVVVQHPMYNYRFDVFPGTGFNEGCLMGTYPVDPSRLSMIEGAGSLRGFGNSSSPGALEALVHDLNNPNIDDRYVRFPLVIGETSPPVLTGTYLTGTIQPSVAAPGEDVSIQGFARGNPTAGLQVWIAGNDFVMIDFVQVNNDSGYYHDSILTSSLPDGEYTVIVQHPMYNNDFAVFLGTGKDSAYVMGQFPVYPSRLFGFEKPSELPFPVTFNSSATIDALVHDLNNPNIDDRYIQLKFVVGEESSPPVQEASLSVNVSPLVVSPGDRITISGKAKNNPEFVLIWLLGKNFDFITSTGIRADSTFEYELADSVTRNLSVGEYAVVVQDPGDNNQVDVFPGFGASAGYVMGTFPVNPSRLFKLEGSGSLQGSNSPSSSATLNALVWDLNNPNIDDRYKQAVFEVVSTSPPPTITSLEPGSVPAGSNGFSLVVNGKHFINGARVVWNGQNRTTAFVSSSELIAEIQKVDVASPGSVAVKVVNPDMNESEEFAFSILPKCSIPVTLPAGWSLFSTPVSLDPGNSTLPGIFPLAE